MQAKIRGFGAYLPGRVVDNEEIGALCGADPEWIKQQTGIEQRRWAAPEESVADLGVQAARDCLDELWSARYRDRPGVGFKRLG